MYWSSITEDAILITKDVILITKDVILITEDVILITEDVILITEDAILIITGMHFFAARFFMKLENIIHSMLVGGIQLILSLAHRVFYICTHMTMS